MTQSRTNHIEAALYAYLDNEMVAALDFTRTGDDLCVNLVFVKLQFRRRGTGSALARYFVTQHTGAIISWASRMYTNDAL